MAIVASRIRLRRSRCASEPSSDSASTATFITSRGCAGTELDGCPELEFAGDDIRRTAPLLASSLETIRMPNANLSPPCRRDTGMSCCDGLRLDERTLALLEHVLVLCVEAPQRLFPSIEEFRWRRPSPTNSLRRGSWCATGRPGPGERRRSGIP